MEICIGPVHVQNIFGSDLASFHSMYAKLRYCNRFCSFGQKGSFDSYPSLSLSISRGTQVLTFLYLTVQLCCWLKQILRFWIWTSSCLNSGALWCPDVPFEFWMKAASKTIIAPKVRQVLCLYFGRHTPVDCRLTFHGFRNRKGKRAW